MGAAFCRLVEQSVPRRSRLFDDPVVVRLLDPMLVALAAPGPLAGQLPDSFGRGTYGLQVMRTRYIDDAVTALAEAGITQVVILGAGLDTRAYRLPALGEAVVFEVDLPELQERKRRGLAGTRPTAREVRFVATDFTEQGLDEALTTSGLDRSRPVLFVWEGVTQYLPEAAVRSTLAVIGASAQGSALLFTYVLRSALPTSTTHGWSGGLRQQWEASEPWLFGLDPGEVPVLLAEFGLTLVDDSGATEYRERYLDPIGRQLEINDGERVAFAHVNADGN